MSIQIKTYTIYIDEKDLEIFESRKWKINPSKGKAYAVSSYWDNGKVRSVSLHRLIMGFPKGLEADHINGNSLDNRRENLRVCTREQNTFNRAVNRNNRIGVKGVSRNKSYNSWISQIQFRGKKIYIGSFKSIDEASRAYEVRAKELFNEYAYTGRGVSLFHS